MQLIQPRVKELQKKYGHDRERLAAETMALYKETGTNPFASCLPIILQAPIFYALFRVLNTYVRNSREIGPLTKRLAEQADNSTLFGAPLSSTFMNAEGNVNVKVITIVLIILMSATTFTTQRQLMMKNMPAAALDNPFAKQQKMLLYVLPVVFAVSGVNFPIGVLLYWLTTNAWSMGQQFYVIRRMPAPGSPAEKALQERRRKHGRGSVDTLVEEEETPATTSGQRAQPKRQARSKRTSRPEVTSAGSAPDSTGPSLTKKPLSTAPASDTTAAPSEGQRNTAKRNTAKRNAARRDSAGRDSAGAGTKGAEAAAGPDGTKAAPVAGKPKSTKPTSGKPSTSPAPGQSSKKKRTKPSSGGTKPGQRPR
jgi:YidC/Oxa1 family membrane protein insertase